MRKLKPVTKRTTANNPRTTAMAALQPGQVVRLRYATKRSSSNQGRGVRRVRVVRGAHDDGHYKHGPIIVVEDLSDPYNPGQTKTGAKNPEIEDPWAKRSRYDSRQPDARSLSWDGYKPEKNPEIHGVQLRDLSADTWRMHCCICKKPFTGGGHNPRGFTSKYKSGSKYGESHNRCCGKCNVLVEQRRGEK